MRPAACSWTGRASFQIAPRHIHAVGGNTFLLLCGETMLRLFQSGARPAAFLFAIFLVGVSSSLAQVFPVDDDSEVAEAMATVTAMKLEQGRLKIDTQRWRDVSYPPENGNQEARMIKDRENHGHSPEDIESWIESGVGDLLSLFSAKKQLNRLRLAAGATGFSGGVSSDLRLRYDNREKETSAAFRARVGPFSNISLAGRRPTIQELALDDNATLLFRLRCRVEGRMGMLTQNRAGRIQLVYQSNEGPVARTWESYRAMRGDPEFPKSLAEDLDSFAVTFPDADSESTTEVPPSFLSDGPLPSVRRSMSDLAKLSVQDGRIGFDRQHWVDKAGVGPIEAQAEPSDDPFQSDPFGRLRSRQQMQRRRGNTPLQTRIDVYAAESGAVGRSSGGSSYQREMCVRGDSVLATFLTVKEPDRVKMTFSELTRHGRSLTLDDIPNDSFVVIFGDPDRSLMFFQDESGKVSVASCSGLKSFNATFGSYADFVKDKNGRAPFTSILDEIGVVFPESSSE